MSLLALFCDIDDFCQAFTQNLAQLGFGPVGRKRGSRPMLSMSEIMTIVIRFHQSSYRNFKAYYTKHVMLHMQSEFPNLVSYNRFVELMPYALLPLCFYLHCRLGEATGISFVDATPLAVCLNRRIARHKVFAGLAARGKISTSWSFGFKLHLVVNDRGELLAFFLTPVNVDDRKPVSHLAKKLWGKLFGDKGNISQSLSEQRFERGLQLITPIHKNMKNRLMPLMDKLLVRKRAIIETINDQLKNISQIEHTQHRSTTNFLVNLVAGLIAYTHQTKKPSLNLTQDDMAMLPATI